MGDIDQSAIVIIVTSSGVSMTNNCSRFTKFAIEEQSKSPLIRIHEQLTNLPTSEMGMLTYLAPLMVSLISSGDRTSTT